MLATLSALLPLLPPERRRQIGEILELAGQAVAAGGALAANLTAASERLAAARREFEAMVASGRPLSAEDLDAALARVRTASAAFRSATPEEA
jgi:hypothetical protein